MKTNIVTCFIACALGIGSLSAQNYAPDGSYSLNASAETAVVATSYGKVAGYIENDIYTFKGIPYAEAKRFMPPHAPKVWEGVRSSRAYGPCCPQEFRSTWLIDEAAFVSRWDDGFPGEDCLRVNVWTQGLNDGKKRPVMVWIHGGGFSTGSSQEQPSYDGASLARKGDIVMVSLNHRLNVLGFLNLSSFGDKYKYSANLGMLDIIEALKWVKNNIAAFGGDPDNVTIFGQSGGGRKVSTLLCMPAAKGLFHKAIVQSGSGANFMPEDYSSKIGQLTVRYLGLDATTIDKLADVPYEELLEAGTKAVNEVKKEADASGISSKVSIWGWMPTKDGDLLPEDAFANGSELISKDIPMMVGSCLNEMAGFVTLSDPEYFSQTDEQVKERLTKMYGKYTDEYISAFKEAYPELKATDMPIIDFKYRPQALKQVETKVSDGGAPVWNYLFAYYGSSLDGAMTATHCMELPYVFNNVTRAATMTGATLEAIRLGNFMSSAWINFARTGNPNVKGMPEWPAYTTGKKATMIFNAPVSEVKYGYDSKLLQVVEKVNSSQR